MENWLLFPILLVLSLVWLYFHRALKVVSTENNKSSSQPNPKNNFHAVSIHTCAHPCENVESFKGRRFLAREVTQLPVEGCTHQHCTCGYVHHQDRRSGEDRRYPSIAMQGVFSQKEHRAKKSDRRKHSFA